MRLATVKINNTEQPCILTPSGPVLLAAVNRRFDEKWPTDMLTLIRSGLFDRLRQWHAEQDPAAFDDIADTRAPLAWAPLYRHPGKIWGIGLNYAAHAADLSERPPTSIPASFMKPDTTIIGPEDSIEIPVQSEKTTAEAELGIIIGTHCKNVPRSGWRDVVAGFTTIIDMTAEDILRQNPRYLTVSKSFDTFFSFGPCLITPDEIQDVTALTVATVINGRVHAENTVANMTFPPDELVAFHSAVMTLQPGDIISTGTPGAVRIAHKDRIACRITGFEPLENPVTDLKRPVSHGPGTAEP